MDTPLPNYLVAAAKERLEQGSVETLPARLVGRYYLAHMDDDTVSTLGTVEDGEGVRYKIGTKKNP